MIAKIQRAGLLDEQGDDYEVSPVLRLMIGPDTAREFIALYREAGVGGLEDPADETRDNDVARLPLRVPTTSERDMRRAFDRMVAGALTPSSRCG